MTRRAPNMTEKLAAALLLIERGRKRVISHAEAKTLSPEQIVSRFEPDHDPVRFCDQAALGAAGIPYIHHPSNITWRPRREANKKTHKKDVPEIAKRKRIVKRGSLIGNIDRDTEQMFPKTAAALRAIEDVLLNEIAGELNKPTRDLPLRKIPSRPFPPGHRPLRGRSTFARKRT